MPRIRQYAERYAAEDFWKEIDRCCPLAGIQSDNASALGERIGEGYQKSAELPKGENRNAGKRPAEAGDHPPPQPGGDPENTGVL